MDINKNKHELKSNKSVERSRKEANKVVENKVFAYLLLCLEDFSIKAVKHIEKHFNFYEILKGKFNKY